MYNFEKLITYYKKLNDVIAHMAIPEESCGNCKQCCIYPSFYFFLTHLEYSLIIKYLIEHNLPVNTEFTEEKPGDRDKRDDNIQILCPWYSEGKGCTVYEVRPICCRLYGYYMPKEELYPFYKDCVYKNPIIISKFEELPFSEDYIEILISQPSPRGYFLEIK